MIDKLISIFCRLFFAIALLSLLIAIWDRILRLFGWSLTWITYTPRMILELSAMLMIFVIALLLRQIREELKK